MTVFIVIAIVVVVVVAVFLYVSNVGIGEGGLGGEDVVENSIIDCIDYVGQDGIETLGIQGGFYQESDAYLDLEWAIIPYYKYGDELLAPSTTIVEEQLGVFVDDNIGSCIEELEVGDFELSQGEAKTSVDISAEEIEITVDMLVNIKKGESITELSLKDHPRVRASAMGEMLDVARYITTASVEETICISCLYDMLEERDLYFDSLTFTNDSSLIILSENSTTEDAYAFEFLLQYPEVTLAEVEG